MPPEMRSIAQSKVESSTSQQSGHLSAQAENGALGYLDRYDSMTISQESQEKIEQKIGRDGVLIVYRLRSQSRFSSTHEEGCDCRILPRLQRNPNQDADAVSIFAGSTARQQTDPHFSSRILPNIEALRVMQSGSSYIIIVGTPHVSVYSLRILPFIASAYLFWCPF
jgi:hypothetical protein